jgi:hypothetical protein
MLRRGAYALLAVVCATGLVISFVNQMDERGPSTGEKVVRYFSYFTIESNILVLVVATVLATGAARRGSFPIVHLDALLGITVTGLIFAFVLAPDQDGIGVGSVLLHYVSPPLMLLAWLAFGPWKPSVRAAIVPALAWPVVYLVWTFLHGALSDWYPYGFINADTKGTGVALRNAALVVVLGLVLLLVFTAVNRRRSPRIGSRAWLN